MAKAKSKKITIEEALVPVEEQEYNIPDMDISKFCMSVS